MNAVSALLLFLAGTLPGQVFAAAPAAPLTPQQEAVHVLNRLGYGPRPGDVEAVVAQGVDAWIDAQLHPRTLAEPPELKRRLAALTTLELDYAALFRDYGPPLKAGKREQVKEDPAAAAELRRRQRVVLDEAMQARLLRALESPRQLEEVMVDFWFNHFNVDARKGLDRIWIGAYERDAIRPYALGRFRDLLGATAHSPAMLFYLDNWQSSRPGVQRRSKASGLNENYARELLELHTLGVDGGYTQNDVTELARILTGWSFDRRALATGRGGAFRFDASRHDEGDKQFLGHLFRNDGENEGERALDLLAADPKTARHLAFELAQYFVADAPPPALVTRLARTYRDSDGDIARVLAVLFKSPEFRAPANVGNKYKTPYQYIVSALRAADLHPANLRPALRALDALGMPLYGCLTPDGYKNTQAAWLTPGSLMDRVSFASALGAGRLPFASAPEPAPDEAAPAAPAARPGGTGEPLPARPILEALGPALGSEVRAQITTAAPALQAALALGSPDFMGR